MDVTVTHTETGPSCVVDVSENENVAQLKEHALDKMFAGDCMNTVREAAVVSARIEGCEELDDAQLVADTGLEAGGAVELVPRWPQVKAPVVYTSWHGADISNIALSRSGRLCAVGGTYGHVTVFDTVTAAQVSDFKHLHERIQCIAFSICGTRLATCTDFSTLVWKTAEQVDGVWQTTEKYLYKMFQDANVRSAAWSHGGLLLTGDEDGEICAWNTMGAPGVSVLKAHSRSVRGICVSRTKIFSGSEDKTIRVWDINTLERTHSLRMHTDGVTSIALSNDDQHLVSCSLDKSVKVWCTRTLSCLRTVLLSDPPRALAVSQPGDVIAVRRAHFVYLYRLSTGGYLGKVGSEGGGVALSPCGKWIFTPRGNTSVSVAALSPISP